MTNTVNTMPRNQIIAAVESIKTARGYLETLGAKEGGDDFLYQVMGITGGSVVDNLNALVDALELVD